MGKWLAKQKQEFKFSHPKIQVVGTNNHKHSYPAFPSTILGKQVFVSLEYSIGGGGIIYI